MSFERFDGFLLIIQTNQNKNIMETALLCVCVLFGGRLLSILYVVCGMSSCPALALERGLHY